MPSVVAARAARSRRDMASEEWLLEISLLALFLRVLEFDCRPDVPETEVTLVTMDNEAESRELVVGVLAYVVEEVDPRFGVKLARWLPEPCFFRGFSGVGE